MNERRSNSRGRTLEGGRILFHQGRSAIDCAIRNFSEGGACVEVANTVGIPATFELQLDGEIITRQCTQRWTSGNRIGVSFDAASRPAAPPDTRSRTGPTLVPAMPDAGAAGSELMRGELLQLRTALDRVALGVVLLDAELRAQFINRAFRKMWRLPDAKADTRPAFVALMYHGRDTRAYELPEEELATYVAERVALVKAGHPQPMDLRLSNGEVLRFQCTVLPAGGRMLSYTPVTDIVRRSDELEYSHATDELTGLRNRRHFMQAAHGEWDRFLRYHRRLSLLSIDIDHFKSINDKYGYEAGDTALAFVADACNQGRGGSDIAARMGGEEFMILLPETALDQALKFAERLRAAIAQNACQVSEQAIAVTVSIGVAEATAGMAGIHVLMKAADEALYGAKAAGRNCIAAASPPHQAGKLAAE